MRLSVIACVVMSVVTALVPSGGTQAQGWLDKLKQAATGDYTVRGRLQTHDGQWLTCFNNTKTGYLGPADLARPGDARLNPATGQMQLSTAAIPAIVFTREGVVTSNDCDSLAAQHLLALDLPPDAAAAPPNDGLIHDKYGCGVWTEAEFRAADKDEIMACQARAITEREYARQRAAAGAPAGASVAAVPDPARQAAIANLQSDTAAKFAAIQAQAGVAAPAVTQSAEDLAWDGAKLCNLKPAYMMKLKDEATEFVRMDTAADRIVMSEMVGGARQEVVLDGNAFAQRASFNASAIGQGGDICGRAFWNAEAYKAATAAMSGQ